MSAPKKATRVSVSSTTAQRQFGEMMRRAYAGDEHIVIQQNGLPVVVILSIREYEDLMNERERREQREKRIEDLSRQFGEEAQRYGLTEEQLLAKIQEIKP